MSDDVVVRVNVTAPAGMTVASADLTGDRPGEIVQQSTAINVKSTKTTIPFVKDNEFDYSWLVPFAKGETKVLLGWLVFMPLGACGCSVSTASISPTA